MSTTANDQDLREDVAKLYEKLAADLTLFSREIGATWGHVAGEWKGPGCDTATEFEKLVMQHVTSWCRAGVDSMTALADAIRQHGLAIQEAEADAAAAMGTSTTGPGVPN